MLIVIALIERKQKERQIFVQRHVIKTITKNRRINMLVGATESNKIHNFRAHGRETQCGDDGQIVPAGIRCRHAQSIRMIEHGRGK